MADEIEVRRIEARARLNEDLIKYAQASQNIVFGMGYAGYFALWFGVRDIINPTAVLVSGLAMLLSITIYVCWAIFSNHVMMQKQILAAEELDHKVDLTHENLREMRARIARSQRRIFVAQPAAFYCTLVAGLFGICVLVFGFVHELYHIY